MYIGFKVIFVVLRTKSRSPSEQYCLTLTVHTLQFEWDMASSLILTRRGPIYINSEYLNNAQTEQKIRNQTVREINTRLRTSLGHSYTSEKKLKS